VEMAFHVPAGNEQWAIQEAGEDGEAAAPMPAAKVRHSSAEATLLHNLVYGITILVARAFLFRGCLQLPPRTTKQNGLQYLCQPGGIHSCMSLVRPVAGAFGVVGHMAQRRRSLLCPSHCILGYGP